ncbi:hypothetical protein Msil_2521 [Methylocella silvestris BL2]|uniref:AB hydrolase-1 domain-containing protein n=1 Tax=Methylocella silvestris (strain DSM 15510 / CIP 108128 / LMG 27833 / NCIMB 13906 / BL2) TaxID=395965 RepID=B8EM57_METSB|nr:hypothetical protein [Methylocella silvestris]ACK51446.1 hypothetical protein Msil_2521 [Methylocella silvestris BL2]
MRHHRVIATSSFVLSAAVLAASVTGAAAWQNPLKNPYVKGKLNICDQGSFFVGGVPKVTNFATSSTPSAPQQITIGQMYVQFQIPDKRRQWPLIIMHGSSHTGACLEATPDGREGWLPYALRKYNLSMFIVDQPGRGRSGFDQSVIQEGLGTNNLSLIPTNWGRITDNGAWTSWFGHLLPAGSDIVTGKLIRHGDPGDPDPPEDFSNPSEAHGKYPPAFPIPPRPNSVDLKVVSRVGAIGPAPNPANNTYLGLEYYKQLVPNAEVTLPTSQCAACTPTTVSGLNTFGPRALADLIEGLGGAVLSGHSQAANPLLHTIRYLKEDDAWGKCGPKGACLAMLKGMIIPEGAGFNPDGLTQAGLVGKDFDKIPFLLVNGDYRPLATRIGNRQARDIINASKTRSVGPALVLDTELISPKFNGQTHMNMIGFTNLELFDFIMSWADKNIKNPIVRNHCDNDDDDDHDHGHDHGHH